MADQKVITMVLKVDLQCPRCYEKVRKILAKFPQIRSLAYDEMQNTVTITVVCCNPEKFLDKLCCKGGKTINPYYNMRTSYWPCRSEICVSHPQCAEAAVVGVEHGIKGQNIHVLVTLAEGVPYSEELRESLVLTVRNQIPESDSGFIDKNVINEELENHPAQPSNVEHVADANSSDQQQNGEDMYSDDEIDLT